MINNVLSQVRLELDLWNFAVLIPIHLLKDDLERNILLHRNYHMLQYLILADIMNDIDIMILTLSSSSVNVVFNASILRYMAQYMNAYIIWLYCAALNWKDFIYSKLTILTYTWILRLQMVSFFFNITNLKMIKANYNIYCKHF